MKPTKDAVSLFFESQFDPRLRLGVGCKLVLSAITPPSPSFQEGVLNKDFEQTKLTRVELQTLIWAIEEFEPQFKSQKITVYTQSPTAIDLLERRAKLEKTNFSGATKDKQLANADLYKDFFSLHDKFGFEVMLIEKIEDPALKNKIKQISSQLKQHTDKELKERLKSLNTVADKWF